MDEPCLDVRSIPPSQRHPKIFALFDTLAPGQALTVISDHEPRPLRAEFEHERAGAHHWSQRQFGDGRWEVRIERVDAAGAESPVAAVLSRCAAFRTLDPGTLDLLAYHARRIAVRRGHVVVDQAVNWPYLGVVERGVVQATLSTPLGREQTMYEVMPNESFAEVEFLDGGHTPLRFLAVPHDTVVVLLPVDVVRSVVERFPDTGRRLATAAAQHLRAILDQFAAHLSESTTARVAHALLPYASPSEGLSDVHQPLPSLTQNEIAMRAGTVKEVVSRALAELERVGALERRGGHITRLNRAKLVEITESEH